MLQSKDLEWQYGAQSEDWKLVLRHLHNMQDYAKNKASIPDSVPYNLMRVEHDVRP